MKAAIATLIMLAALAAIAALPLPLRPNLDFQVLYHADEGLLHGITIYDHAGQVNMVAEQANVPTDQVFVLPFPYPPWYALSTLWLALLPIDVAARLWFGLSLMLLFVSVWWLTEGIRPAKRGLLFFLSVIFPPVLGSLFVGQYSFPVLLGVALMLQALRREQAALTAVAAALLTFKPHLGALLLILTFAYLLKRGDGFGRKACLSILVAAVILFGAGFLASPLWPLDYFHSLTGFKDVSQCHQCTSIAMALSTLAGGGFSQSLWLALGLGAIVLTWLITRWSKLTSSVDALISTGVLATFMVSPYLQNYDYILLLVPLILLSKTASGFDWLWLGFAYAVPLLGLAFFGTAANISLVGSAAILIFLAVIRSSRRAGRTRQDSARPRSSTKDRSEP